MGRNIPPTHDTVIASIFSSRADVRGRRLPRRPRHGIGYVGLQDLTDYLEEEGHEDTLAKKPHEGDGDQDSGDQEDFDERVDTKDIIRHRIFLLLSWGVGGRVQSAQAGPFAR